MKDAIHQSKVTETQTKRARSWGSRMSDHVAYALLIHTGLLIFITVKAMAAGGRSILPYLALVLLVAAIIPACRWFEKRWTVLGEGEAFDPSFAEAFRRDVISLWLGALLLPFAIAGFFKALFALI